MHHIAPDSNALDFAALDAAAFSIASHTGTASPLTRRDLPPFID
jgi:hypothetical protein